jgi:hypothetical protein
MEAKHDMNNYAVHLYEMEMVLEGKETEKVGEINHEPDIHEHLTFNGKVYSVCYIDYQNKKCGVDWLEHFPDFEGDVDNTENIICPYCGYEDGDSWEHDEDEGEIDCGRCGAPFKYYRKREITYCTEKN